MTWRARGVPSQLSTRSHRPSRTSGTASRFPDDADEAAGWTSAAWLVTNAKVLGVSCVTWQGQNWSTAPAGEGRRTYTGGGVHDPTSPVGGHYDHVHVSVLP